MIKKLILTSALLSLAGCAFNQDSDGAKNREIAQNEKLASAYSPLLGTWGGKLTTEAGLRDVSIEFFTLNAMDGTTDADGAERVRKVLRANYRRINPVGESYRFKVSFSPVTGQVSFVNTAANLGSDDVHTIDATLKGDQLVGEAKSETRVVGVLNLRLSSRSSNTGGSTEENEYNERLRAKLLKVAGTYQGQLENLGNITVELSVANVVNEATKKTVPTLIGNFNINDDRSGSANLNLTGVYEDDLNPPKLTLSGIPRNTTTGFKATIEGTVINEEFNGTFTANGSVRKINFKK